MTIMTNFLNRLTNIASPAIILAKCELMSDENRFLTPFIKVLTDFETANRDVPWLNIAMSSNYIRRKLSVLSKFPFSWGLSRVPCLVLYKVLYFKITQKPGLSMKFVKHNFILTISIWSNKPI